MDIVIVDKNKDSRELIASYLKDTAQIASYEDFSKIDCDLQKIDLIIFDINSKDCDKIQNEVLKIKNQNKNIYFIATSYEINSELVSSVLKNTSQEFLIKPVIASVLHNAIKKIEDLKNNIKISKARTIAVYAPKAGSGRTSLAVNLAYELSKQTDKKTCFLDLSSNFGDIEVFLNVQPKYTMVDFLSKIEHADSSLALTLCDNYNNSNLYSVSFTDEKGYSPQNISKLINSLKNIFSNVVIDTPIQFNETMIEIVDGSDLIIILGTLNMASIRSSQKCLESLNNLNINPEKIKYVINRYIDNSEIKAIDVKNTLGIDIFDKIPNNYLTLIDAINLGKCVFDTNPDSNISKAYCSFADKVMNLDFSNIDSPQKHSIYNLLRRMGDE